MDPQVQERDLSRSPRATLFVPCRNITKIIEWAGAPVAAAVKALVVGARRALQLVVEYLLRDRGEALPVRRLLFADPNNF